MVALATSALRSLGDALPLPPGELEGYTLQVLGDTREHTRAATRLAMRNHRPALFPADSIPSIRRPDKLTCFR